MARKIKLTDSVSISELKHMREVEGLSNAEIAKRVGCAVSTVIDHIGKQPKWMTKRNQMAGLRKVKELPPLTENKVVEIDQPKMSFAERCEAARAKAEKKLVEAIKEEPVFKKLKEAAADLPASEPKEADKAREAHCKELDTVAQLSHGIVPVIVHGTMYEVPRVAYEVIKEEALKINAPAQKPSCSEELHALVEELKVMFSPLSVLDYLKCKLYELGTPHIIYADREAYLTEIYRLISLQEGAGDV